MGRVTRITLLILFIAAGAAAAVGVAIFAIPAKPSVDRVATAFGSRPRQSPVSLTNPLISPAAPLDRANCSVNQNLWTARNAEWASQQQPRPAPPGRCANEFRPQAVRPSLENQSAIVAPPEMSAAPARVFPRCIVDAQPPALFYPTAGAKPIAAALNPVANQIIRTQANGPLSAGQASPPIGAGASPAPNSPAAKQQVADGMDELRKLLEASSANNRPAESISAPSPAGASYGNSATNSDGSGKPSKARAKISRVGEGDDHFALDIQDADIRDVLEMISRQGQINILPSNSVKGRVTASLHDVDLDSALAAILKSTGYVTRRHGKFIYVGTAKDFDSLEQSLDKIGTRIYRTNYVRASDLQALITPLLTQGVGAISVTAPAEQGIGTDSTKAGGNNFAGGDAVLVKDYEAVLAQIDEVVGEIDKRPLQVAIEAMILSVALNDNDQFGVEFQFFRNNPHIAFGSGNPPASISDVSFANGGLTFGFLDSTLGAFLTAVETVGDTHVIATPRVVCLDKQRAEILIGSQLGYISSTVTETSTAQNVNFLEVGTQLRIRPFISSDGLVRMEVHPELSTGQVTTQGGFTLPDKDLTQVTTNVMVRDGATVVIGGLIREDLTTNTTQIPVLGNLPGVGWLFRQKQETTQRNEILVLITPHIVYDCEAAAEGEHGATEFHRRESVYADQMSPLGKRHIGRTYYRLAQEAFAAGDQPRALRFIDLSIHFDPLNRAAISLRTDIVTGNHFGEHTAVKFPTVAEPSATMVAEPGAASAPGSTPNDMNHPPFDGAPPPEPDHPLDPGRPGTSSNIPRPTEFE